MNVKYTINPDQVQRCLAIGWKAGRPMNLVGAPGTGKTSAVNMFAATVMQKVPGAGYWTYILAMKGVEDFGLPAPDGTQLKYLWPNDLPIGNPKAKGIIFLDEWDRCPDVGVQNAAMQLTLGGNFHGTVISKDLYIVLAMNGTSDIYTSPISEAARTRLTHLYVSAAAPGYLESFGKWASVNGVPEDVAGFMRSRTDLLRKEKDFEELSAFNFRTGGSMLARLTKVLDETKIRTDDIELPLIAGTIGYSAASEFMAYRKVWKKIPDLDNVLRNPTTATVPTEPGILFSVGMGLARKVDNNGNCKAALKYIARWPEEPAAFAAMLIQQFNPAATAMPEFAKWATITL